MDNKETLLKEIDLIQSCINRMADNSFLLKGWTVTILVGVLALFGESRNLYTVSVILLIAILNFWYLDAFFLRAEKMYRELYNWVIGNRMNTLENAFDLNPNRYADEVDTQIQVMFSKTLKSFYGVMTLVLFLFLVHSPVLQFVDLVIKNSFCKIISFIVERGFCS